MMRIQPSLIAVTALLTGIALSSGAQAVPAAFGPARLGFTFDTAARPTYTFGASSGTLNLGDAITPTAKSGTLSSVTGGVGAGSLTFSTTIGTTINEIINSAFVFNDPNGNYTFNISSVETVAGTGSQGGFDEIELYALGTASGGVPNTTATASSLVFNITGANGQIFTDSESFANPPDQDPNPPSQNTPVPEPASLALLSAGIAAFVAARRRSKA